MTAKQLYTGFLLIFGLLVVAGAALLVSPRAAEAQNSQIGWDVECSHRAYAYLDPIGGATHLHEFVGVVPPSNSATVGDMKAQTTNCDRPEDTAGYWIPAIYKWDGTRIVPDQVSTYYRSQVPNYVVSYYPEGLKMVAGDPASTTPQPLSVIKWDCKKPDGRVVGGYDAPWNCPGNGDHLRVHIDFPQCWDGYNLDSWNHKAHMLYAITYDGVNYGCPYEYPIAVPRLSLQYRFASRSEGGIQDWTNSYFSSGGRYSMHADFWETWRNSEPRGIDALVRKCIRAGVVCGASGP